MSRLATFARFAVKGGEDFQAPVPHHGNQIPVNHPQITQMNADKRQTAGPDTFASLPDDMRSETELTGAHSGSKNIPHLRPSAPSAENIGAHA